MRFFRFLSDTAYAQARAAMDAAFGYPDAQTESCIDATNTAPRDAAGLILLAVRPEFCEPESVAAILGDAAEITVSEYLASLPVPSP